MDEKEDLRTPLPNIETETPAEIPKNNNVFVGSTIIPKPLSGNVEWEKKAQNILLKYSKTKTLTTELFIELMNLLTQFRNDVNNWSKGGGNDGGSVITPPNIVEITPEQIRDKLSELLGDERLDASSIKNITDNVFVKFNGQDVKLQVFMEYLWNYINELENVTREKIIELIGFEPLSSEKVVQDLNSPSEDTVISTSGLATLLSNIGGSNIKWFEFVNLDDIICEHGFDDVLAPTVYIDGNIVFTYVDNTQIGKTIIKFKSPKTGKVIINGSKRNI